MELSPDFGEMFVNCVMRRKHLLNMKRKKENCKFVTQRACDVFLRFMYLNVFGKLSAPLFTTDDSAGISITPLKKF